MTSGKVGPVADRVRENDRDKSAGRHIPAVTTVTDRPWGLSVFNVVPEPYKSSGTSAVSPAVLR